MWDPKQIEEIVKSNKAVIFGKGSKEQPMCGFTHKAIELMRATGKPFEVVNIFDDESIRPALVSYSGWPTTPQLFVNGELIGGSDIIEEELQSGELQKKLDSAFAS